MMEIGIREAKARLSELIRAARNGERIVITVSGQPAVELCVATDEARLTSTDWKLPGVPSDFTAMKNGGRRILTSPPSVGWCLG